MYLEAGDCIRDDCIARFDIMIIAFQSEGKANTQIIDV